MAQQMTPEEIQRIQDEYADAQRNGTRITQEMADALADSKAGINGYSKSLRDSFGQLGKSAADLTSTLYKGAKSGSELAENLDTVVGSLGTIATLLMPGGLLVKGVMAGLTVLGVGAAKLGKAAIKQSDQLFDAYQDLSRIGAATAKGMSDVFPQMQKFGYGLEDLNQMTALIRANSKSLAQFSGTVGTGTKQLAGMADGIQHSGMQTQFMNMGMSVDEINKALAGYYTQQGRLGRLQGKTQDELTKGAADYIKEMEILTRLTGQQREEMEQQRDAANSIDQFYATISEMGNKGEELYKVFNQLMAVDPSGSKARAFAESVTGFAGNSEDQNKLLMASGGYLLRGINDLKTGTIDAAGYLDKLGGAVNQNIPALKGFAKTGAGADVFGSLYNNAQLANKSIIGFGKSAQEAENSINVIDPLTGTMVDIRQTANNARDELQSLVQAGIKPATKALQGLTNVANKVAGGANAAMPGAEAPNKGAAQGGGSSGTAPSASTARKATDYGATAIGGVGGALGGAVLGAKLGATAGSVVPGIGTLIGGAGGALAGAVAGGIGGAGLGHTIGSGIADFFGMGAGESDRFKNEPYGTGGGGAAGKAESYGTGGAAGKATGNAQTAFDYFKGQGYTKEQAAGLVGNLQAESGANLNTQAVGDGGRAVGIAQWHPDRQKQFQKILGKTVQEASLQEQLYFVDWELKNTEARAGAALRSTKTAEEAAQIVDKMYERSSGMHIGQRMKNATAILAAQKKAEFGGVVKAKPGGTNILAGEAGADEAFVPLVHGKIPVDIKNSEFIKAFTKDVLLSVGPDRRKTDSSSKENIDSLKQLIPDFSKAISLGIGDIKINQPQAMDPQTMARTIASIIGDLKQPPLDYQALAKTITGNLGESKQLIDTQAIAKAITGNLGDLKQPPIDTQAIAKAMSGVMTDLNAVRSNGSELFNRPMEQDKKISDSVNNIKSMLDNFVDTKMPTTGSINSVMPDFSKLLPSNDIATSVADKINQQTVKTDNPTVTTPLPVNDNSQQLALMNQQLNKLDELVRVMSNQLNVSNKILQYQH